MKEFFKTKWFKRIIAIAVVLTVAIGAFNLWRGSNKTKDASGEVVTAVVTRRSIVNTVTGSGTVEAYETYNIVPTVTGDILECSVDEGQWVEEGQVLYRFDTETSDNAISKALNSVENAALSLEQAQENVDNLTIKAPAKGVVSNLSMGIGDKTSGSVCTITDNTYMIAEIPVSSAQVGRIGVGDKVTVGLEKYMTTVTGVVDRKSSGVVAGSNGAMVTNVDVIISSPGSISEGTYCSATFHTSEGDVDGAEAAVLNYPKSAKATAEQSGTVKKLNVKNGDWVDEGDVIAVLENSQVTNQLRTAQMNYSDAVSNLSDKRKAAEDYVLTAPISGKIMEKKYKKGDTVAGNNSTTLMVVADTTRMKFTINVDELDVAKITIGQEVSITADAIERVRFKGVIETVSHLGSSSSGVTYYPVQVRIDNPGDLLPGMNVSAEIIVESAQNVISVPSGAVTYYDGKYYVTVVGEVEGMEDLGAIGSFGGGIPNERPTGNFGGGMPNERPTGNFGGGMPNERPTGNFGGGMPNEKPTGNFGGGMPQGGNRGNQEKGNNEKQNEIMYPKEQQIEVTTGVSDDDYIEITSGLEVGKIVKVVGSSNQNMGWGNFGGMRGGMPGGMPQGRMR